MGGLQGAWQRVFWREMLGASVDQIKRWLGRKKGRCLGGLTALVDQEVACLGVWLGFGRVQRGGRLDELCLGDMHGSNEW